MSTKCIYNLKNRQLYITQCFINSQYFFFIYEWNIWLYSKSSKSNFHLYIRNKQNAEGCGWFRCVKSSLLLSVITQDVIRMAAGWHQAVCSGRQTDQRCLIDQPSPPAHCFLFPHIFLRIREAHQRGVDRGWVGAVGEVVGVVLAGCGRRCVRRAVHPQRRVQLRAAARQEPVLVGGAVEGGGGGLRAGRPVRHRPGNRIAASGTGVCRHEKLHEENRGQRWSFSSVGVCDSSAARYWKKQDFYNGKVLKS